MSNEAAGRRWVHDFSEGSKKMVDLLGGKGANMAEMTKVLGEAVVPAGFTITTEASVSYMASGGMHPSGLLDEVAQALGRLETRAGRRLGDPSDPLLVSVRSGARVSMPGMLDTVLNLGLNDRSVVGLAQSSGDERFAWDSYRRFVQMYANVVSGVDGAQMEAQLKRARDWAGAATDAELGVEQLKALVTTFKEIYADAVSEPFPQDPREQLHAAISAVFDSWTGERAVAYRRINHLPDTWGTAVNVQQMVFGNRGPRSASGVAFSRDEITGGPQPSGDFLIDAQGEDVVSGVRNASDLAELATSLPDAHAQLLDILRTLEHHYKDMQDTEFTIEDGRLFMLQTRSAKRPAQAAVRFAVNAVDEGLLTKHEALATIDADALDALLHPTFDPTAVFEVLTRGVPASPGAARGAIVFSAADAVSARARGEDVVLVRPFTQAEDVAGFHAAVGILTIEGGKASHAALVARGMGRPCVCGATGISVDVETGRLRAGERTLHAGDVIAIDGSTGAVTADEVRLVAPKVDQCFETVLEWCDEIRSLKIRANADTPGDAERARAFGAEGIGLCRTEHMFLDADRHVLMRQMILAKSSELRNELLVRLGSLQRQDFEGIFAAMSGLPVAVRLLDPPLHEFLPDRTTLEVEFERAQALGTPTREGLVADLEAVRALEESNPMLGVRGVRLGLVRPEIYEMQAQAIFTAYKAVRDRDQAPILEITIPLVGFPRELEIVREQLTRAATDLGLAAGEDFTIGTMIELPRACFAAAQLAAGADYFSFGTNDLTQTGIGLSRDDVEGRLFGLYIDHGIFERSPFESIDQDGVGEMLQLAARLGREVKPGLKLGVCGEHGGDPTSIQFFHEADLTYVSCSPFRVPVARVAAAQATIRRPRHDSLLAPVATAVAAAMIAMG